MPTHEGVDRGAGRVSVIIPFFNAIAYLDECIGSVLAQTFTDWELLLVDDASRDGSEVLAHRHAMRDPDRIRYLEHRGRANRGVSASRNLGLSQARGDYVAFLDADDVWLPTKLEEQVQCLQTRTEALMVYGRVGYWYSWTGRPEDARLDHEVDMGVAEGMFHPPVLVTALLEGRARAPLPSDALFRTAALHEVGGFEEDRSFSVYEDRVLFVRIELAGPVYAAEKCWVKYRQHHASSSATIDRNKGRTRARSAYLRWLEAHLVERGYRGSPLWRLARQHSFAYRHPVAAAVLDRARRLRRRFLRDQGADQPRGAGVMIEERGAHVVSLPAGDGATRQAARSATTTATRSLPIRLVRLGMRRVIPPRLRALIARLAWGQRYVPPAGLVRFGDLRRVRPISVRWGKDRGGLPIDRYYIERFLTSHAGDIRGRVLEVGDDRYTAQYGGDQVERSDVLHVHADAPGATIVDDLTRGAAIPTAAFDCVILTQVVQFVVDPPAALRTVHRILKPGGVLLMSVPGISQISRWDMERWGDYWRFTTLSVRHLLNAVFPSSAIEVRAQGNVLAAVAFLHGLAAQELEPIELDYHDADFEVLITIRATRPEAE